ncbi:MAG: 30S ribosomal protein S8 [uncultured bacterium]|uniref:Small ribosomal subunit protein uS8 n=1 Tax=candidate division WWE3 bacterium RBG_16_37_10 TaxID=1802610 RepID=A0A1F4UYV9_UNCKA|nr:MAG: 30S ribosomal protein S8 [uncultured bacterium]OGC50010.1 MAG: 30S ribosomal protein S8 [candidate division WWE3 bacterium RBG_16_37_10]
MLNDRLANMLSTIKNAYAISKPSVEMAHSKQMEEVAKVLEKAGFLKNVKVFKESGVSFKKLHLDLTYDNGMAKISNIVRVSKPGRRVYKNYSDLKPVVGGFGISVVSTSRGIMSDSDAKKRKLGGEVICTAW